jgi:hypothetical protein
MGEITANERRLQSTKRAAAAAAKRDKTAQDALKVAEAAFKAACKNADDARSELSVVQADQKDAEACLEAAHKKWEVVDLGEDDGESGDEQTSGDQNNKRGVDPVAVKTTAATCKKSRVDSESDSFPEQVVVEGAGSRAVNGVYKRSGMWNGSPGYTMEGKWNRKDVVFELNRQGPYWDITVLPHGSFSKNQAFCFFCVPCADSPCIYKDLQASFLNASIKTPL